MRLLIVDDNPVMRLLMRRMLADLAETITECSDGCDVLDTCTRCRPDWVLMDIGMNNVNGIQATRQLTAIFPEARVVMVTQFDNGTLRSAAREAGACGYVLKDNLFELRNLLRGNE